MKDRKRQSDGDCDDQSTSGNDEDYRRKRDRNNQVCEYVSIIFLINHINSALKSMFTFILNNKYKYFFIHYAFISILGCKKKSG